MNKNSKPISHPVSGQGSPTCGLSPLASQEDTICALATASGGALGIIRVSGPDAFPIVTTLCSVDCGAATANTVHFTHIIASPVSSDAFPPLVSCDSVSPLVSCDAVSPHHDEVIDEALVTIFRAPHSYTGEDSVEISCHGSPYILNKVLDRLVQQGCRMAQPGEFTKRAYLNGKMDLSQAEAVADLIASKNKATHQIAMAQLRGHFSSELKKLRHQLLQLTSLLELELDFSDHEDLEFANRSELLDLANKIDARIMQLARSFETGQALKKGIPVAIVGKTNVGKSTLLNQLLHDDRAIVSNIHGTTRDTIEGTMEIDGVEFRFIDTAGIRQTNDEIEQIGIDRTKQKIQEAQIIVWLLDERPTKDEDEEMSKLTKGKRLICVHNKADLIDMKTFVPYYVPLTMISAKKGEGIDNLKRRIFKEASIAKLTGNDDIIVTNARHYDALLRSHDSILRVIDGLHQNLSGDLLSEDLRQTLDILAEITGGLITPQETLNSIFQNFCVGK